MSNTELALTFSSNTEVNVTFGGTDSGILPFANPVTETDRSDIRWYVETYGAASLADPDDQEAKRIEARLPEIGKALFNALFSSMEAFQLFLSFRDTATEQRVLTINARGASILSLPWELLHDPTGVFLFRERPPISVRRRIPGATGGRSPFKVDSKDYLHLLFVVSRPTDAGFIDPRADPEAVLDALEEHASGRVTWEFLRPATLNALVERLNDESKPAVDILHFDGHGVFKRVSDEEAKENSGFYGKSVFSEIQRERQTRTEEAAGKPVGIGFLVFEKEDHTTRLISAADLSENLFRSKVGLVVLSACQTAALDEEGDPMASVAGRLTGTGIPAILAMNHSVLVATTRLLFGEFYASLARGRGIATALDTARVYLANNPERYEVKRGDRRQDLTLEDWFVPALFHGGADVALLTPQAIESPRPVPEKRSNLRERHEAGFFGRRKELWDIYCWFATEKTRRISITGFGGQGKSELAMEAGRWLLRTGLFERVVLVGYSRVQSEDALSVAVSTLSTVLEASLTNSEAATKALASRPTLLILDNMETIAPVGLDALLDAAVDWSNAGESRVLLTTRGPDFNHPEYRIEGTRVHRRIPLEGLGSAKYPDDALAWFAQLSKLPSAGMKDEVPPSGRDELIELFDRVAFHPLSIAVLAQQLRTRTARQLGERLQSILEDDAVSRIAQEGTPPGLIASLQLSLEQLNEAERHAVQYLAVVQGGAFEDGLLTIKGLDKDETKRKQIKTLRSAVERGDLNAVLGTIGEALPDGAEIPADFWAQLTAIPLSEKRVEQIQRELAQKLAEMKEPRAENPWPGLRRQLEAAALIEAERVPGVVPPFLRFHPTLAPMLWARLDEEEKAQLTLAHRQHYYTLAIFLYDEDFRTPHEARAVASRELPNLSHAVHQALDAGAPDLIAFVHSVHRFLKTFGMTREAASLLRRTEKIGGENGSQGWHLAQFNRAEQLRTAGQSGAAAEIYSAVLQTFGDAPSYEVALTLGYLGSCYVDCGRPDLAEAQFRNGIAVTDELEQSDLVKRHLGLLHTSLGDALQARGKFGEACEHYKQGLESAKEINDWRHQVAINMQLGTLAQVEGNLPEALQRQHAALKSVERLSEPHSAALVHNQLGVTYYEADQLDKAEHHYRESARLKEELSDLAGASGTWMNLAIVCKNSGRPEPAETWFLKAIEAQRENPKALAASLYNFACLLLEQPGRLAEARQVAEDALALKKTQDPGATKIWDTYELLADITNQESDLDRGAEYHRQAREAKRNFAGTAHEMRPYLTLILGTLQAVQSPENAAKFSTALSEMEGHGGTDFLPALRKVLAGERNADALCKELDLEESMIVETILQALEDPPILKPLLSTDEASE